MVTVKLLAASDSGVFTKIAEGVFDHAVDPELAAEFLSDPRHHIAVALEADGTVVGMASAVHYIHPDKPAQLFINEVAVSQEHRKLGIGTRLLSTLFELGASLACTEAWVATDPENRAAQALYERSGGVKDAVPFVMYTFPFDREKRKSDGV